jgi:hypothetical protein
MQETLVNLPSHAFAMRFGANTPGSSLRVPIPQACRVLFRSESGWRRALIPAIAFDVSSPLRLMPPLPRTSVWRCRPITATVVHPIQRSLPHSLASTTEGNPLLSAAAVRRRSR